MVQDACGGVANVEKNLEKRAMLHVFSNARPQRFGVLERRQRAVDAADHFTKKNLRGGALQQISAARATKAIDDARAFQIEQDALEKFFRQILLGCDVFDFHYASRMLAR